jgi:hypothetical protein
MLCDTYRGGTTVAAATPERVGEMDAALPPLICALNPLSSSSEKPIHRKSSKHEMKYQSHEKQN